MIICHARTTPKRRVRTAIAALALAALALTGCSSTEASSGSASGCAGADTPLTELKTISNPREWVGESSGCLGNTSITPVADTVTSQLPVTVTDNQGTEVTITDTSRILALDIYGSLAATVFGLGLGDNVVGRDTSTGFDEAKNLPLVTQNGHELNGEAILSLEPSVIITDSSIGPWDVILQMRDSGIPVVVVTPERNLENTGEIIDVVASALGVPEQGEALKLRVQTDLDAVVSDVASITPTNVADRPRIIFLYARGNAGIYYIFGTGSGTDSLITSLGGVDVATEIGWQGMRPMTAEALVDAQPDLILMMTKGLESVGGVDGLLERIPAVAETPAGQHRRIVDMSDYEILSFGPRSPAVVDALARAIYAPEESGPIE
ncbi:heme/hemin ABC transporter substrate-binding protein [Lysinibacter cavernae]|uniref:Iron complex transport system substrate-binding protein n=1 Tax=Lysinibacter cavernae TaxID=1640652 RepID=A0A7X5R400_9MICO|nr:ABC transporter substrate-binding protein [Lysinibacter cavernae]NIH55245.1 iron complex transport system substrate-binding protein [Lysinibacter cavernae]